jgi:hypothetical protein
MWTGFIWLNIGTYGGLCEGAIGAVGCIKCGEFVD